MKTVTTTVYTFNELNKEAQKKALDIFRYFNVDDDFWRECLLEKIKENLQNKGYKNPEINYSGFYSQGDGASFTSKTVDLSPWFKAPKFAPLASIENLTASIDRVSNYHVHKNTIQAFVDTTYCEDLSKE